MKIKIFNIEKSKVLRIASKNIEVECKLSNKELKKKKKKKKKKREMQFRGLALMMHLNLTIVLGTNKVRCFKISRILRPLVEYWAPHDRDMEIQV